MWYVADPEAIALQTELNLQYQLHIMINIFEKRLQ